MKAISTRTTKGIQVGSILNCIDNTGAKKLEIIAVIGYKGVRKRRARAGVGNIIVTAVKKGNQKVKHQVSRAIVVRQKKAYRRLNGHHVQFSDNAAVLVDEKNEPTGNEIKGAIAKEAVERFPPLGKIARSIV